MMTPNPDDTAAFPIEPIHEDYEPIIKSLVKATALRRAGLNVLEDDELDMTIAEIARIKPLPIVCVPTGDRPR